MACSTCRAMLPLYCTQHAASIPFFQQKYLHWSPLSHSLSTFNDAVSTHVFPQCSASLEIHAYLQSSERRLASIWQHAGTHPTYIYQGHIVSYHVAAWTGTRDHISMNSTTPRPTSIKGLAHARILPSLQHATYRYGRHLLFRCHSGLYAVYVTWVARRTAQWTIQTSEIFPFRSTRGLNMI